MVVNCFQNCIFIDNSQAISFIVKPSNVVNCFQNCIFIDNSQAKGFRIISNTSCELLSELYFYR